MTTTIYKPVESKCNIGIGTVASGYNLDIYNQSTARIRLQTSADYGATTSIEFRKGVVTDLWSDYRLINDNATFKLQYENADFPYGDNNKIITWKSITCKITQAATLPSSSTCQEQKECCLMR